MNKYLTQEDYDGKARAEMGHLWDEMKAHVDLVVGIAAVRIEQGLSQKELADKAGLKQPAIARFENCSSSPTLGTILKITTALGLDLKATTKNAKRVSNIIPFSSEYCSKKPYVYSIKSSDARAIVANEISENCV